jgi:hypothetical protein
MFLDVMAERGQVFVGWFTFAEVGVASIGDPAHRWLTAQGAFNVDGAALTLTRTRGGEFASNRPVQNEPAGTLYLRFTDCNHGLVRWQFLDGSHGEMPIQRLAPQPRCAR